MVFFYMEIGGTVQLEKMVIRAKKYDIQAEITQQKMTLSWNAG
ncbi:MAG TPA: hypothetical protein VHS96_06540 [Bacteroidia bacterium]|nr:hypothetical protein [Bacteroidia bacterium]